MCPMGKKEPDWVIVTVPVTLHRSAEATLLPALATQYPSQTSWFIRHNLLDPLQCSSFITVRHANAFV